MARLKRNRRKSVILPNGQRITLREQKALRSAVNSANRKRKRMLERLPEEASRRYREFGIESDFVMRKKSASLSRFRNKKEFDRYLRNVRRIASGEFERKRADKAIRAVKDLDLKQFRHLVESGNLEEIGYVYYDPNNEKITKINSQLGLA